MGRLVRPKWRHSRDSRPSEGGSGARRLIVGEIGLLSGDAPATVGFVAR
ncbi:MAG TPA: hypothetical protein VIL71_15325 [Spirillospora sp.]